MSNKINHELPSLTPDRDQVETFKSSRTKTAPKADQGSHKEDKQVKAKTSGWTISFIILILALGSFGGWWFHQQNLKTQAALAASDLRIKELEKQLSVTGEEMGESTVAMKVRLEKLTKQTEELWVQMDKLWASAWRRNQSEIAKLSSQSEINSEKISKFDKESSSTSAEMKKISQKLTETDLNIGILSEQVQTAQKLKSQLESMNNSLATLQSKSLGRDKQLIDLAAQITTLNEQQRLLSEKLTRLESRLSNTGSVTVP